MENGNVPPPIESTPHERSPKNLSHVITLATPTAMPNLVHIRPWGLLGELVKYNQFFKKIYALLQTHLQVRQVDGFSHHGANDADLRKDVPFCFVDIAPHFWGRE